MRDHSQQLPYAAGRKGWLPRTASAGTGGFEGGNPPQAEPERKEQQQQQQQEEPGKQAGGGREEVGKVLGRVGSVELEPISADEADRVRLTALTFCFC